MSFLRRLHCIRTYIYTSSQLIAESMPCTMSTACSRQLTLFQCSSSDCKGDDGYHGTTKRVRLSRGPDEDHFSVFCNFSDCVVSSVVYCLECTKHSLRTSELRRPKIFSRGSPLGSVCKCVRHCPTIKHSLATPLLVLSCPRGHDNTNVHSLLCCIDASLLLYFWHFHLYNLCKND